MSALRPSFLPLAAALLAAIVLAGCGNDRPDDSRLLSHSTASNLRSDLNAVERLVGEGDCDQAKAQATAFQQKVGSLRRLDPSLRDALRAGAARLETLVSNSCTPASTAGASGATGPAETQPKKEKPQEEKPQKPAKEKGKGQQKQNQEGGGDQNGGAQIGPGQTQGGTGPGGVQP